MSILDFLFKGRKKEEVEKPKDLLPSEQVELRENSVVCNYCENEIFQHDKRIKLAGKSYHRKCMKKLKRMAHGN